MKRREIEATGMIDGDGRLKMFMGELNEFFKSHKGKRVIARFTVVTKGTSEALLGYYFKYIVPTMKAAFLSSGETLTEEQTEHRLREISPIMRESHVDIESGNFTSRIKKVTELSNAELIDHIDFLKQFAAEELNTYIEDPRVL